MVSVSPVRVKSSPRISVVEQNHSGSEPLPASGVQVSGHTDNRGSDALNLKLSEERSEKVGRFLVEVGNIEGKRVSSKGYGKTRPLASNETDEGRAANRRVEILIVND